MQSPFISLLAFILALSGCTMHDHHHNKPDAGGTTSAEPTTTSTDSDDVLSCQDIAERYAAHEPFLGDCPHRAPQCAVGLECCCRGCGASLICDCQDGGWQCYNTDYCYGACHEAGTDGGVF